MQFESIKQYSGIIYPFWSDFEGDAYCLLSTARSLTVERAQERFI